MFGIWVGFGLGLVCGLGGVWVVCLGWDLVILGGVGWCNMVLVLLVWVGLVGWVGLSWWFGGCCVVCS